jgi:hypothetical protein
VTPDGIHCPQTDRSHLKEAQIAVPEQMEEPVAAALHIRHDHRDRRPAAGILAAVADANLVAVHNRGPQACMPAKVAAVAGVARKEAGYTATAVERFARASVVLLLLPVPEPVATGSVVVRERLAAEGSRRQAQVMALETTMPAWHAQRLVGMALRPACLQEQILRERSRPPFWRTRTCPGRKMHCAFLQPLQLQRDADADVLQTHRLLHLR